MSPNVRIDRDVLGDTLSKYQDIALILNSFPVEQPFSTEDVAEKANVHWNTAKKALTFFLLSKPIIPDFSLEPDFRYKIKRKPTAISAVNVIFESEEMRIVIKLLMKGITNKEKGRTLNELRKYLENDEINNIYSILEKGYINSEEGIFYLSTRGKLLGNRGIKKLMDLGIPLPWEEKNTSVKLIQCFMTKNRRFDYFRERNKKSAWPPYQFVKV